MADDGMTRSQNAVSAVFILDVGRLRNHKWFATSVICATVAAVAGIVLEEDAVTPQVDLITHMHDLALYVNFQYQASVAEAERTSVIPYDVELVDAGSAAADAHTI